MIMKTAIVARLAFCLEDLKELPPTYLSKVSAPDRDLFKGRNLKRFIVVNVENAVEDFCMGVNFCIRGIGDG